MSSQITGGDGIRLPVVAYVLVGNFLWVWCCQELQVGKSRDASVSTFSIVQ